jgi:2'-hydroxyisoflavone reductase
VRLLVLGGTLFLGPHVVSAALARGHSVTMFNRGVHNPDLFPEVERVRGDRNVDLSALAGRPFDAVIDTSGYTPAHIRAAADVLESSVGHYVFISSISVYDHFPPGTRFDEDTAMAAGDEGYGASKARAEEVVDTRFSQRSSRIRPGLIVGPRDPTDRFTYWPRRVAAGGRVLAPGRPERPVQYVDVRDLAEWCVRVAEQRTAGAFNAVGPSAPLTMGGLLNECRRVLGSDAEFVWVRDGDLLASGVQPWTELPLWIPEDDPDHGGMLLASNARAVTAGLTFRPIADTIRDTFEWDRREGADAPVLPIRVKTMERTKERELLAGR